MSADISNIGNIANIHRIKSLKNKRPITAINKRKNNNEIIDILQKGNIELEKLNALDVSYDFFIKVSRTII